MIASAVRWIAGEPTVQRWVERALAIGFEAQEVLHASARRSVHRLPPVHSDEIGRQPDPQALAIKTHHTATGRHRLRERIKRAFRQTPGRREWNALQTLHASGVSVPRPWAWGRLANGDEIVVTQYLRGEPIQLPHGADSEAAYGEILDALASAIRGLHDAGYRHADLHLGNLLRVGTAVVLLDLQRARPLRAPQERLWDLAHLEFSLARAGFSPAQRASLRARLEVDEAFDPILRRFLRDHLRGRARRVLRVGRNWSRARVGRRRGLRDASLDETSLAELARPTRPKSIGPTRRGGRVAISEASIGPRAVIVKHFASGGVARALVDRIRGTTASRAFRTGQTLGLVSSWAAHPIAYLEERRFGFPTRSWLFLEKVGEEDLDQVRPGSPEAETRIARALGAWLADAHAFGLSHRDQKAGNLRIRVGGDSIQFWMIDLEDLRGPSEPSDEARIRALSQLNASLSDEAFGIAARLQALEIYRARLPFSPGLENPLHEIARLSLARNHRWRGEGCESLVRSAEPPGATNGSP